MFQNGHFIDPSCGFLQGLLEYNNATYNFLKFDSEFFLPATYLLKKFPKILFNNAKFSSKGKKIILSGNAVDIKHKVYRYGRMSFHCLYLVFIR